MANQLIKRVTKGGYIKADTTGTGTWEVGKIIRANDRKVWFVSANDGQEVWVSRGEAFKATAEEYKQAKNAAQDVEDTAKAEFVGSVQQRIAEQEDAPESVGLTDMEHEANEFEQEQEDAPRSMSIKPEYRQRYGSLKIDGRTTQTCGDETAMQLVEMDLPSTYRLVASECSLDVDELMERYAHLNNGQQKMCLSNRLRAFRRKAAEANTKTKLSNAID